MQQYLPQFTIAKGEAVPDFKAKQHDGKIMQLSKVKAKWIVLFFYPQDNTPTCTKEACNLRDNYSKLEKMACKIYGISPDDEQSHLRFREKYQLPYPLIVDHDHEIASLYGVWSLKQFMGKVYEGIHRSTFIIDQDKKLFNVIYPVVSAKHHEQIIEIIKNTKQ